MAARPVAKAAAAPASAPAKAASTAAGAVAGGVVGAGIMTGAYTALRWFAQGGPVVFGVAAVGIGLAALGGSKIGAFVQRGFKFQDFTIGGAAGGALAVAAFAGGGAMLASFGAISAPAMLLMGTGAALAGLGGAAIGHAAQDAVVGLFKK
jgi:hypothetical protein